MRERAPADVDMAATFGRRLRWERERRELSLSALSKAAGFSKGRGKRSRRDVICRWERGETVPLLTTAKRLADALGITLDELVTEPPGPIVAPPRAVAPMAEW